MLGVHLKLARASNLPTVWSNVLAGAALGGGSLAFGSLVPAAVAVSAFYVGGMYLNDAFDARWDRAFRRDRPIPSGQIAEATVFRIGFSLLGAAIGILFVSAAGGAARAGAVVAGLALAGVIVLYDAWHKNNPASPFIMGACRVLAYLVGALATGGRITLPLVGGAAVLLAYLIGLTYTAKHEAGSALGARWPLLFLGAPFVHLVLTRGFGLGSITAALVLALWVRYAVRLVGSGRPGAIPQAVGVLIAGIPLVDALLLAGQGRWGVATLAMLAFPLTLLFHRRLAGT